MEKTFGGSEATDMELSPEEKAVIENLRAKKTADTAAAATRETREQLVERIEKMPAKERLGIPPEQRDAHLAELCALLAEQQSRGE
jgi:hypothetical protein